MVSPASWRARARDEYRGQRGPVRKAWWCLRFLLALLSMPVGLLFGQGQYLAFGIAALGSDHTKAKRAIEKATLETTRRRSIGVPEDDHGSP